MKRRLALAATIVLANTACAAASAPPTPKEVIAAFKAKDWARLKQITSDHDVFVRPDAGVTDLYGPMARDELFDRMRDCVFSYAGIRGQLGQTDNNFLMICPKEPTGRKPCDKRAFGMTFEIVGNKAVFGPVFHTADYDRVECPINRAVAPPPPAPPPRRL